MEFPFSRRQISIQTHKLPPKTNPDFYTAAFLHTPQAILVLTRDGRILDGNPAACQLFGCSLQELRESNIYILFPNQHANTYQDVLETELTLGNVTLHTSMQSMRGTAFQAEIVLHAYNTDERNLLLAYIQDVSERANAERRFEERQGLLDGTRHIASHLLSTTTWENEMPSLLAYLGVRLGVTRVCVFRNVQSFSDTLPESATGVFHWYAPNAPEVDGKCDNTILTYVSMGLQRWQHTLSQRIALYGDVSAFPVQEQPFLLQRRIQSLSVLPIFVGEHWWGFLAAQDCQHARDWRQSDIEGLQTIADMLGSAIQRQETEQRLRKRQTSLRILNEITSTALSDTPMRETLFHLARELSAWLEANACYVSLWDEQKQVPVPMVAYGDMEEIYPRLRIQQGTGTLTEYVLEIGHAIFIENVQECTQINPRWVFNTKIHSAFAIPMLAGQRRLGAVMLAFYQEHHIIDTEARSLAEQAVQQISLALGRIQLFQTTQRQLEELSTLQRVSATVAQALDEETMLQQFIEIVGEAFYNDDISVLLIDHRTRTLAIRCSYSPEQPGPTLENVSIPLGQGITGYVAQNGKAYRSGNIELEAHYINLNPESKSEICVPIKSGLEILGVLNAENNEPDAFDESDERLLATLADNLGTALMRLRLLTIERKQRQQAETLQEVSAALTTSLNLETVLHNSLVLLHRVLPYDSASIIMLDVEKGIPQVMAQSGYLEDVHLSPPSEITSLPHIRTLLEEQQPVLISDTRLHDTWLEIPGTEYARCWMGVPLIAKEKVIGWLNLDKEEPDFYDQQSIQLALAFAHQTALALENARLYNELETSYLQTVLALARAMDARDSYTADHSQRLAAMSSVIARELNCDTDEIQAIEWAALLHDIGKIGVPDHILLKPGTLDDGEWEIMRRHPDIGAEIISPVRRLSRVIPIVRAHQEKFDGSGYPRGLKGEEIPLGARILAVVDSYSAITDERVYRKGRTHQEAIKEIERCAGSHFDPQVVATFKKILKQGFAA